MGIVRRRPGRVACGWSGGPGENLLSLAARLKTMYLRVRQVRLDPDPGEAFGLDPFLIIGRWVAKGYSTLAEHASPV
jgi:hypothetical protein